LLNEVTDNLEFNLKRVQDTAGFGAIVAKAAPSDTFVAEMLLELDEFWSGHGNLFVLFLFFSC
jgi:hypothetical protein